MLLKLKLTDGVGQVDDGKLEAFAKFMNIPLADVHVWSDQSLTVEGDPVIDRDYCVEDRDGEHEHGYTLIGQEGSYFIYCNK